MLDTPKPTEARAVEAMVAAWFQADAHHAIEDTCRVLYRAAMNAARPTPTDSDVEQVLAAFNDERNGKPCGNVLIAGCEAAGYCDPENAARGFARTALASLPDVEEVREFGDAADAIDFAAGHCEPEEAIAFLDEWRAGWADRWPGYIRWLAVQRAGAAKAKAAKLPAKEKE